MYHRLAHCIHQKGYLSLQTLQKNTGILSKTCTLGCMCSSFLSGSASISSLDASSSGTEPKKHLGNMHALRLEDCSEALDRGRPQRSKRRHDARLSSEAGNAA